MKDKFLNSIDNNVNLSRFLRFLVTMVISYTILLFKCLLKVKLCLRLFLKERSILIFPD